MIKLTIRKRYFLVLIVIAATMFCGGCLSYEDRVEGRKNLKEAKPFLRQYVKDNYGKGTKISNYEYVKWTKVDSTVGSRKVGISPCVTAKVQTEHDTFTIMYNINTGEYSSDEYLINLEPELLRMFNEDIGFTEAFECDIDFSHPTLDVNNLLPVDMKPSNLTELYENADYLSILIYCTDNDWNEDSFSGDDLRSRFDSLQLDENRGISIYVLNMYDKDSYAELKSQDYSDRMWFNIDNIVDLDGLTVNIPEESYLGKYASSAYYIMQYQEELFLYSINESIIKDLN